MYQPTFISHGSPTLPFDEASARDFLRSFGARSKPTAILMVSAHWETDLPAVNAVAVNNTIHDFRGFPAELYALRYPAPGSAGLAERVAGLVRGAGFPIAIDLHRGLDHGAWVPLLLAYPEADVPVVQLSVQPHLGPEHHWRLGRALAPLVGEGVQILASGSFTHDLSSFRQSAGGAEPAWVTSFADWMDVALREARMSDLLHYRALAPFAERNHPTEEHLLPLFVAAGAGGCRRSGFTRARPITCCGWMRMRSARRLPPSAVG
jgi:4,5-DOPA dioxygenase extradiol